MYINFLLSHILLFMDCSRPKASEHDGRLYGIICQSICSTCCILLHVPRMAMPHEQSKIRLCLESVLQTQCFCCPDHPYASDTLHSPRHKAVKIRADAAFRTRRLRLESSKVLGNSIVASDHPGHSFRWLTISMYHTISWRFV